MAKTLLNAKDCDEIARRIAALTPDSPRRWGVMSIGGMICHLTDGYLAVMGEKDLTGEPLPIPPPIAKFLALRSPIPWGRNLKTAESVRQGGGGTPPTDFAQDHERLVAAFARFCSSTRLRDFHPMFNSMRRDDWMRWGYLHADHHLRQFSA